MTRSGASLKSPEVNGQLKGRGGGKKRGRKRKAEENSYKISDFVDNQVRYSGCGFAISREGENYTGGILLHVCTPEIQTLNRSMKVNAGPYVYEGTLA